MEYMPKVLQAIAGEDFTLFQRWLSAAVRCKADSGTRRRV